MVGFDLCTIYHVQGYPLDIPVHGEFVRNDTTYQFQSVVSQLVASAYRNNLHVAYLYYEGVASSSHVVCDARTPNSLAPPV